jgi:hypothetical protein
MINNMPTDTYYRGYRLSTMPVGTTRIFKDAEALDITTSPDKAKVIIDDWLNAS